MSTSATVRAHRLFPALRQAILDGRYEDALRLQGEVCEDLGCSPQAVRDAVRRSGTRGRPRTQPEAPGAAAVAGLRHLAVLAGDPATSRDPRVAAALAWIATLP